MASLRNMETEYQNELRTALHNWHSGVYSNVVHVRKMMALKKIKKFWNNRCATSHPPTANRVRGSFYDLTAP